MTLFRCGGFAEVRHAQCFMPLICFIMGHIAMESLPACMCSIMGPISWLSPSSRSSAHTRGSGGPIPHSLKERGGETGATPWAHASQIREPLRCRVVEDNYRSARSSPHDMRGTRRWTTAGREVPLDRPGERQTAELLDRSEEHKSEL